jgi:hypothetical protein
VRKINIFICLFAVLTFFPSCAFQDEWPDTYEGIEWEEITQDQAIEIWKGYDTSSMRLGPLTIWQKWLGTSPQKWVGCTLVGDSYKEAEAEIALCTVGKLTTDPAKENENALFYRQKGNNRLVKIERSPLIATEDYELDIYKDGWAVVKNSYGASFSRYELFYIKYPFN